MSELTETAPERIWLQVDAGEVIPDESAAFPPNHEDVTWASESIGGAEVEYVRVDMPTLVSLEEKLIELCLIDAGAITNAEFYDLGMTRWRVRQLLKWIKETK